MTFPQTPNPSEALAVLCPDPRTPPRAFPPMPPTPACGSPGPQTPASVARSGGSCKQGEGRREGAHAGGRQTAQPWS